MPKSKANRGKKRQKRSGTRKVKHYQRGGAAPPVLGVVSETEVETVMKGNGATPNVPEFVKAASLNPAGTSIFPDADAVLATDATTTSNGWYKVTVDHGKAASIVNTNADVFAKAMLGKEAPGGDNTTGSVVFTSGNPGGDLVDYLKAWSSGAVVNLKIMLKGKDLVLLTGDEKGKFEHYKLN